MDGRKTYSRIGGNEPYPDDMEELLLNDDDAATNSDNENYESEDSEIEVSDID